MGKEREVYEAIDRDLLETHIRPLVTQELVEEHRARPVGQHSEALQRVLTYLRRNHGRQRGNYVIVTTSPEREWAVARLSGVRGILPAIVDDVRVASREAAEHAVFLRRLADLDLLPEGVSLR